MTASQLVTAPPPGSGLSVDIRTQLSGFTLSAALDVAPGEVLVVIGPNGSGKSTLLRTIAGLHPPDHGRVIIANTVVDDVVGDAVDDAVDADHGDGRDTPLTPAQRSVRARVPVRRRHVGLVFQDYQLFEHLDVLDNVAFGPRCAGASRRHARANAREWLKRLDLTDHAALRPWQLSGGQQQRVALARALAETPSVLLLDEPLAALDVEVKASVRRELRAVLSGFEGACVIVTHDPVDVYAFADRVAVLDNGQVVQSGTLASLTAHPRSRFIAELVGTNLVSGQVTSDASGTVLRAAADATQDDAPAVLAVVADFSGPAFATVRPSSIALSRAVVDSSARNTLLGTVVAIDRAGDRVRVTVAAAFELVAEITVQALESLDLTAGDSVYATVKATDIVVYPA